MFRITKDTCSDGSPYYELNFWCPYVLEKIGVKNHEELELEMIEVNKTKTNGQIISYGVNQSCSPGALEICSVCIHRLEIGVKVTRCFNEGFNFTPFDEEADEKKETAVVLDGAAPDTECGGAELG